MEHGLSGRKDWQTAMSHEGLLPLTEAEPPRNLNRPFGLSELKQEQLEQCLLIYVLTHTSDTEPET